MCPCGPKAGRRPHSRRWAAVWGGGGRRGLGGARLHLLTLELADAARGPGHPQNHRVACVCAPRGHQENAPIPAARGVESGGGGTRRSPSPARLRDSRRSRKRVTGAERTPLAEAGGGDGGAAQMSAPNRGDPGDGLGLTSHGCGARAGRQPPARPPWRCSGPRQPVRSGQTSWENSRRPSKCGPGPRTNGRVFPSFREFPQPGGRDSAVHPPPVRYVPRA